MAGVVVVDRAGVLWYARPDMNGRLPGGRKSWEFGCVTLARGAEVWGDWMTEDQALAAISAECEQLELAAEAALYMEDDDR